MPTQPLYNLPQAQTLNFKTRNNDGGGGGGGHTEPVFMLRLRQRRVQNSAPWQSQFFPVKSPPTFLALVTLKVQKRVGGQRPNQISMDYDGQSMQI